MATMKPMAREAVTSRFRVTCQFLNLTSLCCVINHGASRWITGNQTDIPEMTSGFAEIILPVPPSREQSILRSVNVPHRHHGLRIPAYGVPFGRRQMNCGSRDGDRCGHHDCGGSESPVASRRAYGHLTSDARAPLHGCDVRNDDRARSPVSRRGSRPSPRRHRPGHVETVFCSCSGFLCYRERQASTFQRHAMFTCR